MITLAVRLKNLAFLVIAVLVLGFVGIRYADLGRYVGAADYYTVDVELPRTGGLFTHSDVTYRGVSVGRVGPIDLTADGVVAHLRIKKSAPSIPADARAVVAGLSAVGEQYIDLRPESDTGPYLEDGTRIEQPDTEVPAPVTDVLAGVNDLTRSVPLEDLRTVVDEFGAAFEGHGDDLQVLLDNGSAFVEAADRALPSTTRLLTDGETVLRTQAEEAAAIRGFADGATELARTLKGSDADLRRLLTVTPEAATQVSGLLRDLDPSLGVVLANLLTTSEVAVTRQRGIEELLVKYPAAVSAGATAVDGGKMKLGLAVTFFKPLPCTAGYGGTRYRNGLDLGTAPALNTGASCTAPPGSGVNVRGSANAPRGGPVPEPARPGSLPSGSSGGSGSAKGPTSPSASAVEPLPGALALPDVGGARAPGLAGLLGADEEGGR
ncbi:putative secreted protein [Streptomyces ambofaciens ATCC 23877]|uniref:ABC transporter substrate-binding protein n=2 Tax=Streptomyces ambofaciens TaxID=1889 RepID=A0ABM6B960_STRAM|nr:MlaD family protein [Streptomyces ambofaciens]AKZ60215.1 putative secreted protein [Streptomyces ambofaciens ATCC 23877]ANB10423.1 ABC transporter substrate-binding protein [Streptomyces ambofaciens]CAJ88132.1 putative secreted protein [Streptomyces ambofaciens ATCC 23877]